MRALASSLAVDANRTMATTIEVLLPVKYVPSLSGREKNRELFTKTGRRGPVDPYTKAGALWRARQAHGSSRTFLHGCLGHRNLDPAITRALGNMYLAKVKPAFSQVRRMSWAWDPGSYSGHRYNLGLAHSIDNDLAATLPAMACMCEM